MSTVRTATAALTAAALTAAIGAAAATSTAVGSAPATAAKAFSMSGKVKITASSTSLIFDGPMTGSLGKAMLHSDTSGPGVTSPTGTHTFKFKNGTITLAAAGGKTKIAGGKVTLDGAHWTVKKGTGKYKKAHGRGSYHGSTKLPPGTAPLALQFTGSISY